MKERTRLLLIHLLSITLFVAVIYLPTLSFDFVLDDHAGVEKNLQIRDLSLILNHPQSIVRQFTSFASYTIGGLQPSSFRVVNILFHIGTALVLYAILRKKTRPNIAFIAAVLFAVHPLAVESVAWISSVTYPQYSFFTLLSLLFYMQYLESTSKVRLLYSYVAFVIGYLTSEKAIVLLCLLPTYLGVFGLLRRHWRSLSGYVLLSGVFAWYVFAGFGTRVESFASSAVTGTVEFLNPLQQVPYVLGTYLKLIFWPSRLTVYQFDERGYVMSEMILYWGLLVAFLGLLGYCFRTSKTVFYFFAVFILSCLPALLPIHIIQIGAERYAYLGLAFFIGGGAIATDALIKQFRIKKWVPLLLSGAIVVAFAMRTVVRVADWQSEMSLREAALRTAPYSARSYNNLGIQYMNEGNYELALEYYKKSIQLNSAYSHPYHNIGHMLALTKRYKEALTFYEKAYELNPYEWKTRQDMGQILFLLGRFSKAKPHLEYAIEKGSPDAASLQLILNRIAENEN